MTYTPSKHIQEVMSGQAKIHTNKQGLWHHDTQPAIVTSTRHEWYKHGMLHREGGPAIMNLDTKICDFWLNNKRLNTIDLSDQPDLFESLLWKEEK